MKKNIVFSLVILVLFSISSTALAANPVKIEVLYLNHGPLEPTIEQMKQIFAKYGNRVSVSWYDEETAGGEQFKAKKGIRQHMPLVIWFDGKFALPVNGNEIKFVGFPTGSGPSFFQGKWTMNDLSSALDLITNKK